MNNKCFKLLVVLIVACFGMTLTVNAENAKRATNSRGEELYIVTKDGVTATLYDSRYTLQTDRAGKIMFKNDNDYPVTIKYQIYGIDRDNKKTLVDKGEKDFAAKQNPTWGYAYQYGDFKVNGRYQKYIKYACAIKVTKQTAKATTSVDKAYQSIYDKVDQGESLSSSDYNNAVKLLNVYVDRIVKVARNISPTATQDEISRLEAAASEDASRFKWLYSMLMNAQYRNNLSKKNINDIIKILSKLDSVSVG